VILTGLHNIHSTSQYRLPEWQVVYSDADVARFWAKVGEPNERGCRLWLASRMDAYGHGQFTLRRNGTQHHLYAHRVAWELAHGPIPVGLKVCHQCDVGACVEDVHLFLGTQADNLEDARQKGQLIDGLGARKLSDDAYRETLSSQERGHGVAMARKYGVTVVTISRIKRGLQGATFHRANLRKRTA
jgi:hypothetical protein